MVLRRMNGLAKPFLVDKLSEFDKVRKKLKWINCLTEFYCGEAMFSEKLAPTQQKTPFL